LKLRQRVIATGMVYLKRFYSKNSFVDYDPRLIGPTCLYLASKVEECVVQARVFVAAIRHIDPKFPYTANQILECEYYVLEELEFYLVVYHPYRPLLQFLAEPNLQDCLEPAWKFVNDSFRTDVHLLYKPHVIALACLFMAAFTTHNSYIRQWLADMNVDIRLVRFSQI